MTEFLLLLGYSPQYEAIKNHPKVVGVTGLSSFIFSRNKLNVTHKITTAVVPRASATIIPRAAITHAKIRI